MSSPGYISVSTIAILASPRSVDPQKGDRNVVFDANFFVVDGSETSSLGLLRYFVPDDMIEPVRKMGEKTFQKAFVVANITSIKKDSVSKSLLTEGTELTDYAFLGDIVQLNVINGDTNAKTHPHLSVAGVVTEFNHNDHSFSMNPSQYANLIHATSSLPIHGEFVESKRWGANGPPKVSVGTTVAMSGFMEVIRRDPRTRAITSVEVEVLNVTFLSSRGGSQTIPNRHSAAGTRTGPRTRFNYDDPEEVTTSELNDNVPSTSQLSAVAKGKRKHEDIDSDDDDEEDIKRERTLSDDNDGK